MRISDWSSDVCSSDLQHIGRLAAGDRRTLRRRGVGRSALFARRLAEGRPWRMGAGRCAGQLYLPFRTGAFLRSEEHTSELQSLMRNSYAVFCLKKQTTQTTTNS